MNSYLKEPLLEKQTEVKAGSSSSKFLSTILYMAALALGATVQNGSRTLFREVEGMSFFHFLFVCEAVSILAFISTSPSLFSPKSAMTYRPTRGQFWFNEQLWSQLEWYCSSWPTGHLPTTSPA